VTKRSVASETSRCMRDKASSLGGASGLPAVLPSGSSMYVTLMPSFSFAAEASTCVRKVPMHPTSLDSLTKSDAPAEASAEAR